MDAGLTAGVDASPGDLLLPGLAQLAARVAETAAAVVDDGRGRPVSYGLPRLSAVNLSRIGAGRRFGTTVTIVPDLRRDAELSNHRLVVGPATMRFMAGVSASDDPGGPSSFVAVFHPTVRPALNETAAKALEDIARLTVICGAQHKQHLQLAALNRHAFRADRMLRLVSEAVSCADALTSLLGELCRHHGASAGRIWRLTAPEGMMHEVSRFSAHPYYMQRPDVPVRAGNSMTAMAIGSNQPQTVIYSKVVGREQFVLMEAAMASGLRSQVSYPMWVQDHRFGISLAFSTERDDLDAIVEDIASFANTIRPALFRKVTEERIRFMAHHDDLTQLGNRAVFNDRLESAVRSASRGEHGLSLLYLDLDGFKQVNDVRGHLVGDKLLAAVAGRLRTEVQNTDTVARIGGDEFAVVQACKSQPHEALQLGQRLVQALRKSFEIDGQVLAIGVSIGIAIFPSDGETPDELLRNADTALYNAKAGGRNQCRLFAA